MADGGDAMNLETINDLIAEGEFIVSRWIAFNLELRKYWKPDALYDDPMNTAVNISGSTAPDRAVYYLKEAKKREMGR